jgi:hypothetical protein
MSVGNRITGELADRLRGRTGTVHEPFDP